MSAHGTRSNYVLGCRCAPCTTANRAYAKSRELRLMASQPSKFVDAAPVRAHVAQLRAAGMGTRIICELSGVSRTSIQALERSPKTGRPVRTISRTTAQRLLAVTFTPSEGTIVDGTGTGRRLQALVAVGWSQAELARRLGWLPSNLPRLVRGEPVREATAEKVRALYDELWDIPAPRKTRRQKTSRTRAIRHAASRGWAPPLAWDDDTIDDPSAQPAEVRQERSHRRPFMDVLEDFEDTRDHHGGILDLAAVRLGMTVIALERALHRAKADGYHVEFRRQVMP